MIFSNHPDVDWRTLFGNDQPIEIEIGCGKGVFLLEAAAADPATNFLGLERQRRWVRRIVDRLASREFANVRVLCADGLSILRDFVPDASVRRLHVYFPDPWWKRRHHKRRFVGREFTAAVERVLEVGGELHLATDVRERFEQMLRGFERSGLELAIGARNRRGIETGFERKYRLEGRPTYYATFTRRATSGSPSETCPSPFVEMPEQKPS